MQKANGHTLALVGTMLIASPATAQFKVDICNQGYKQGMTELQSSYQGGYDELDKLIAALVKAHADPKKYPWPNPDGSFTVVNLYTLKENVKKQEIIDKSALFQDVKKNCKTLTSVQTVVDTATNIAALGMALPARAMHIDVSEIVVAGKPLGSDNALIPKLREQILNGDRGEVSELIRNPVTRPAQIVRNWAHHLGFKHF